MSTNDDQVVDPCAEYTHQMAAVNAIRYAESRIDEGALRHASVAAQVAIAEAILAVLEAAMPWLQATKNGGDQ